MTNDKFVVVDEVPSAVDELEMQAALEIENQAIARQYENSVRPWRNFSILGGAAIVIFMNVAGFAILLCGGSVIQEHAVAVALVSGPFLLTGTYLGLLLRGILSRPQPEQKNNLSQSDLSRIAGMLSDLAPKSS